LVIFDTDVLIWILRGNKEVIEKAKQIIKDTNGGVYITPVQIAEIYAGARKKEIQSIEKLLNSFKHLNLILFFYQGDGGGSPCLFLVALDFFGLCSKSFW